MIEAAVTIFIIIVAKVERFRGFHDVEGPSAKMGNASRNPPRMTSPRPDSYQV